MEQSRLRVGDTLDDYCPRERRLTTHAVVALVEDRIKQTRCMTCEFEHAFKDGKIPPRRKKPETAVASAPQGLDSAPPPQMVAASPGRLAVGPVADDVRVPSLEGQPRPLAVTSADERPHSRALTDAVEGRGDVHEAAVHRRLIRATLPRQEGQAPTPRPIPEFTIRHATSANGYGRRAPDGHRAASSDGKFRGDRGPFGAARHAAGGHRRGGSQPQRFGKKG